MHFSTNGSHLDFFKKNHHIAFEEILSPAAVDTLNTLLDSALAKRLHTTVEKTAKISAVDLFQAGFDLWREDEKLKKATQKHNLTAIASELFQIDILRIAFDQLILTPQAGKAPFAEPMTLQDGCCINPLAGALVVQLKDNAPQIAEFPLPSEKGTALFLSPQFLIDWPTLFGTEGLRFLMIGFGREKSLFRADTKDPHAVALKKLGYVFGDRLSNSIHPILIRR